MSALVANKLKDSIFSAWIFVSDIIAHRRITVRISKSCTYSFSLIGKSKIYKYTIDLHTQNAL